MSGVRTLLGSSRAARRCVPGNVVAEVALTMLTDKLTSLFNKYHYLIFNLTVNVFCNADTSRHICLDGLKPQTKPCVGGLATTK